MKEYRYFVSYRIGNNGSWWGFGDCEVIRPTPIRNMLDVQAVRAEIEKEPTNVGYTVVITNWIMFP